jgi:hypothetical protein
MQGVDHLRGGSVTPCPYRKGVIRRDVTTRDSDRAVKQRRVPSCVPRAALFPSVHLVPLADAFTWKNHARLSQTGLVLYQCCLCNPCMMLLTVILPHGKRGDPPCPACQRVHPPAQRCGAREAGSATSVAASCSDSRLWPHPALVRQWCPSLCLSTYWGADAPANAFPSPTTQRGPEARAPRSLRDVLAGFITTCTEAPETTQHADK